MKNDKISLKFYFKIFLFGFFALMLLSPIFPWISTSKLTFLLQIFNIILIYIVTTETNKIAKEAKETAEHFNKLKVKPVITSTLKSSGKWSSNQGMNSWYITNSCEYAALNVIVRYEAKGKFSRYVLCGSLAGMQELELFWVYSVNSIEILYHDINTANFYKTTIINCSTNQDMIDFNDYTSAFKDASKSINISTLYDKSRITFDEFRVYINSNLYN